MVSEKVKVVMIRDPDGNSIAFAEAIDPSVAHWRCRAKDAFHPNQPRSSHDPLFRKVRLVRVVDQP
jgi:hypothetical protein